MKLTSAFHLISTWVFFCGLNQKAAAVALENRKLNEASDAEDGEYPFFAVSDFGTGEPLCVGSLISKNVILTLASCNFGQTNLLWSIGGASAPLDSPLTETIAMSTIVPHPDYTTTRFGSELNDLAMVVLEREVTKTNIELIAVGVDYVETLNELYTTMGHGSTESDSSSEQVREAIVSNRGSNPCSPVSNGYAPNPNLVICAGFEGGGVEACVGDFGSPLVQIEESVVVGLASYGNDCGNVDFPFVNTRVSEYKDWILENVCALSTSPPCWANCPGADPMSCDEAWPTSGGADVMGDPHFSLFQDAGAYDFQGECDLELLRNPSFASGKGLDLHIRTTRFSFFSFVEAAALKIGRDVLEINNKAMIKINGKALIVEADDEDDATFAGYPLTRSILGNKGGKMTQVVQIGLGGAESIKFHVWDMFIGVFVNHSHHEEKAASLFHGTLGMMGDFEQGRMLGRDGTTLFEDPAAFAAEWQVRNDDDSGILFGEARAPQYPQACFLPEVTERELVSEDFRMAAVKACKHFGKDTASQKACIYDVIATGNLDIADAEVY